MQQPAPSSTDHHPSTTRARPRGSRAITFAVLAVAAASFSLLQSLIVPVLPTLQAEYDTDQSTVTWVLTAYLLSASICTPLLGRIGDVAGKTRVLVFALGALAVGSLAAALAPSVGWLIVARVIQGFGGGVMPLAFGIIRDEFQERMTTAISVIASILAVGFGLGIVLAGPIVDAFGVRGLFWLPMVVTGVVAVAAAVFVPASPARQKARLPLFPAVLLAAWLVALLLGLSEGNKWGWTSPRILGLFAVAVALAALWVRTELRAAVPVIDMQMMRRRGVWTSNVVALCVGFGMFGSFGFLPQLLQTPSEAGYGFGATISESGWLLLPSAVASFLVGFFTAPMVRRVGARWVVTAGLLATGAAFVSVGLFHDATWQLYAATTVQGIGSGLVFSSLAGVVVSSVPPEQTGVATGMNNNIRTIGGSIGSAMMAGVLTSHVGPTGLPAEQGYVVGFVALGVVTALAAFASMAMPAVRRVTGSRLEDALDAELALVPGADPLPATSARA
jgi:EmrB/QacA subfamily drug resistance transporter